MKKHSFQEVEENQNTKLKEELQAMLYQSLVLSKENDGVLTNIDIAKIIKEALKEDACSVAGALVVLCGEKKKINYFEKTNPNPAEKIMNAILGG